MVAAVLVPSTVSLRGLIATRRRLGEGAAARRWTALLALMIAFHGCGPGAVIEDEAP